MTMQRITAMIGLLLPLCLFAGGVYGEQAQDETLVRVNDHPITRADLDRWMRSLYVATWQPGAVDPPAPADLDGLSVERKASALRTLIDRRLLIDRARQQYVSAESAQVNLAAIADLALREFEARAGSRLRAARLLAEYGLTVEQFKEQQIDDVLVRLTRDEVYAAVSVTPAETRRHYEEYRQQYRAPKTVAYRQIFLAIAGDAEEAVQQARAQAALEEIRSGSHFADVADRHSVDGDRHPGGLHTVEIPEDQPDWLPLAVAGLEPGQLSEVRQLAGGLSITRLEEIAPARPRSFHEVQSEIKADLLANKRADALEDCLEGLRGKARIEYRPAARELGL